MKLGLQFGAWTIALGMSVFAGTMCATQRPKDDRPSKAQPQARPPQRPARPMERPQANRPPRGGSAPKAAAPHFEEPNRPRPGSASSFGGGNRPPNATPRQRDFSPEERQRIQQNERRFRQLNPQQQQELRERAQVWQKMTPEQQAHIKNDVLPKWKQMPPDRQRAIQHRLAVLQNMPESARNQHLNDPNFTRGMNEEDKQTLRDLSHLHVGGAPEPPPEE